MLAGGWRHCISCSTENPTKLVLWVVEIEEVQGTSWQKDLPWLLTFPSP